MKSFSIIIYFDIFKYGFATTKGNTSIINTYMNNLDVLMKFMDFFKEKAKNMRKEAEENKDVVVFHAGTKMQDSNLVTNGGRVLGVSATGNNLQEALDAAYRAISKISFDGMQYRRDIGKSALEL